jgi:hypothetical protein
MTVVELLKELGIPTTVYYRLRRLGLVAVPQTGDGIRKGYSPAEVAEVKKKLRSMGIKLKKDKAK